MVELAEEKKFEDNTIGLHERDRHPTRWSDTAPYGIDRAMHSVARQKLCSSLSNNVTLQMTKMTN